MERLTGGPWENGNFYTYWNILPKNKGMDRNLQKVINALGLYEQTNLTPTEIAAMQAELAAYRQAEAEGRMVRAVHCCDCVHADFDLVDGGYLEPPACEGMICKRQNEKRDFTDYCSFGEARAALDK